MELEEIQPEVTVAWAREQIEKKMSKAIKNELDRVLSSIVNFVNANHRHLLVKQMNPLIQQELERRGFEVLCVRARPGEKDYYIINWNQKK